MRDIVRLKVADAVEVPFPELTPREARLPKVAGKAHAVIGMRRAGKTYFLYQCLKERLEMGVPRDRLVYFNWPGTPPYEKGVDIMLATDMITHSYKGNYDTAILVGGDSDYVGAVQAVKDNGKNLEVALFGHEALRAQKGQQFVVERDGAVEVVGAERDVSDHEILLWPVNRP